jgi:hypothetical protein
MALYRAGTAEVAVAAIDQSVTHSLMVPLTVVVLDVLADDSPKGSGSRYSGACGGIGKLEANSA